MHQQLKNALVPYQWLPSAALSLHRLSSSQCPMPNEIVCFLLLALSVVGHPPEYFVRENNPDPPFGRWSEVVGPITQHFESWLNQSGYESEDFAQRHFGVYGSYGGKHNDSHKLLHTPILFFHGNEDGALAVPGNYTSGSSAQISYFESRGYTSAELYVTTWGQRDSDYAMTNDHSCEHLMRLRRFIHAVMQYTETQRINIISHSMGVTVARKLVKGGRIVEKRGGTCDLGPPLTDVVSVFIGISGANYGMCTCMGSLEDLPTCNRINGFWPGDSCGNATGECHKRHLSGACNQQNYSTMLKEMNTDGIREGSLVYSFWTIEDDIILNSALVWGRPTSFIPNSQLFIFRDMTHMQTKEMTGSQQYLLVEPYSDFIQSSNAPLSDTRNLIGIALLVAFLIMIMLRILTLPGHRRHYERIA